MARYSAERKSNILKKLLPPHNRPVPEVASEEGISEATLYNWRIAVREQGLPVPGSKENTEQWPAEARLAVVVETASMNQSELSEYCRQKGLFPEQVQQWKEEFIHGSMSERERRKQEQKEAKANRRQIKELKRELRRKEKALAETSALLVLRKKLNALREETDGEDD